MVWFCEYLPLLSIKKMGIHNGRCWGLLCFIPPSWSQNQIQVNCNLSTSWKTVLRTIMLIVHWTWSRLKDDKLKEIYEVEKQGSGSVSCFKRPSSPSQLSWIWQQLWSLFPCTYNLIPEGLFVCLFLAVRIFLYTAVCFPLHLTI